jgi:hypothetical protein
VDWESLSKLLALAVTALVALGASWLVTRHDRSRPWALVEGYPARDFPRRELAEAEPLLSLCQSQSRLLLLYRCLPASSHARAGLLIFIEELRAVMDGAYELAHREASPAARARLSRLVGDVGAAVCEIEERAGRDLNASSGELFDRELEVRLEIMRTLARDVNDV